MVLTPLEQRVLQFVSHSITETGTGPTLEEVGQALGLRSKGTVHRYVSALVRKGYLSRSGRSWRSLRISGTQDRRLTVLPLLGRIAAGRPIEPIPGRPEVNFSELLLGPDRFVLKVDGDSMRDAGIVYGDLVIVRRTDNADSGTIVVALIDKDEATLRRLRKHGDRIELIPANPSFASMIYPAKRVKIQGIVIGQVRMY